MSPRARRVVASVAAVFGLFVAGTADGATLAIDPADVPLEIRGTISSETTSFGVNARLTLVGDGSSTTPVSVRMLADDLKKAGDPSVVIDRSNIAIASGISLTPGEPTDVRITVSDVLGPGHYSGAVTFNAGSATTGPITLTLDIRDALKVTPLAETKTIRVLRCSWLVTCWAGDAMTHSDDDHEGEVLVENETRNDVEIDSESLVLRGDARGVADADAVEVDPVRKLPARAFKSIALDVDPAELEPDRYTGSVRLSASEYDQIVSVPVDVLIRDGPGWVFLTLLFGIFIGRLVRGQSTPKAQAQLELRPRYEQIRTIVEGVENPAARHYLEPRLEAVRKDIDGARKTLEALRAAVDSLEIEAVFLADLERLEGEFQRNRVLQPHKAELQPKIDKARASLISGKKDEADAARADVEHDVNELLAKLTSDGSMGSDETKSVAAIAAPGPGPSIQQAQVRVEQQSHAVGRTSRALAFLAGISAPSAAVRYWFLRPLLWIVLLFVLVLLGMQFLYVDKDTFGANGLWDYFALFLWGLTADVAAGTLQQLPARPS